MFQDCFVADADFARSSWPQLALPGSGRIRQILREEALCLAHRLGLGVRIGLDALASAARVVKAVDGAGIDSDLDVAAGRLAAFNDLAAAAERHFLVVGAVKHAD